jgi:hypothetical protein
MVKTGLCQPGRLGRSEAVASVVGNLKLGAPEIIRTARTAAISMRFTRRRREHSRSRGGRG